MAGNDPGLDQADAMAIFDQVMNAATPCTTAWEEVGLSALRPSLDEQALAVAENQESSLESRRALAAQAKSFRLSVEAEVGATSDMRAASGALVRAFKGEIDALTTRSRFAEGSFLALYKLLREAPDPAVTVQALQRAARAAVEALEGQIRFLEERNIEQSRQLDVARAAATARGVSLTAEELQEERRILRAEIAADQAETEQTRLQALQDAVQEELLLAQGQAEHERAAAQAQQQVLQQEVERLEARAALVEEEAKRAGRLDEEAAELARKVQSLEAKHETLVLRAKDAVQSERRAAATCAEAEARADSVERSATERVRDLEAEVTRLRRQVEMGADATEVQVMQEKIIILEGIWGDGDGDGDGDGRGEGGRKDSTNHGIQHHSSSSTRSASTANNQGTLGFRPGGDRTQPNSRSLSTSGQHGGHGGHVARGEARAQSRRHGGDGDGDGDECSVGEGVLVGGHREGKPDGYKYIYSARSESRGREGGDAAASMGVGTSVTEDEGGGEVETGRGGAGDGGGGGVDSWLISYNRRLKNELERLRERTRQAEDRLRIVEEKRAAEAAELSDRRQDVKRLEQDLVDAHQVVEAGKTMLRAFQSGPVARQFGKLVGRHGGGGGGLTGAVIGATQEGQEDNVWETTEMGGTEEGVAASEGFSAADRLLGAVKRQRERFRKEALRREREASIAKGNAEQLTRDNQDLRRENMHLYKKMRFVMSYDGGKGDGRLEDGERETESKYERLYEADLDPFKEFDSQEKEARRGQMGFLERWLFVASGTVLRNRFRRHLLVVYLLVLHGLLLVMHRGGGEQTPGVGITSGRDVAGDPMP